MAFEDYVPLRQHLTHKPGVRLGTSGHLVISYEIGQQLGFPDRVVLSYDRAGKQIRLAAAKPGDPRGIKTTWNRPTANSKSAMNSVRQLGRAMPVGFYAPVGGNTFVHESQLK